MLETLKILRIGAENYLVRKGDSDPNGFTRQILSLNPATDSKADQGIHSADSGKVLQNPQTPAQPESR